MNSFWLMKIKIVIEYPISIDQSVDFSGYSWNNNLSISTQKPLQIKMFKEFVMQTEKKQSNKRMHIIFRLESNLVSKCLWCVLNRVLTTKKSSESSVVISNGTDSTFRSPRVMMSSSIPGIRVHTDDGHSVPMRLSLRFHTPRR